MTNKITLGFDVGGTNIRAGIVNKLGEFALVSEAKTPDNFTDFKKVIDKTVAMVKKKYTVSLVGIGLPGLIDHKKRTIKYLPNLPFLNNKRFSELSREKNLIIVNDVDLALLAEIKLNSLEYNNVLLLNIGTGLGSAYYLNGIGAWNFENFSAEIGHNKIVANGRKCHCGQNGCLEAYFSGWAILEQAKEIDNTVESVEEVFERARIGEVAFSKLVKENTKILALVIANTLNTLPIDTIVIGGKLSNSFDLIINGLRQQVEENVYAGAQRNFTIVRSTLVDRATIIGASIFTDF